MNNDKVNLEHAIRVFELEMGYTPDPTNTQDKATVGILEVGIRYALSGNLLTKRDLDSFHDAVFNATDKHFDEKTLYKLWLQVPSDIKDDAQHWGASDTVVSDHIYEWAQQNPQLFEGIGTIDND
jgi:uncharacterized protein (DUF2267 family)